MGEALGKVLDRLSPELASAIGSAARTAPEGAASVALRERGAREALLQLAQPAITEEDWVRIVSGAEDRTRALSAVQGWLEVAAKRKLSPTGRPIRTLVLIGAMGVGKTVAAAYALAREPGKYLTAEELSKRMRSDNWRDAEWRDGALWKTRLLVVDDVGAERNAIDARAAVHEVVNARQRARTLTLLTGNLTKEQFAERYDPRTLDRIKHTGLILPIAGESMRGR